MLDRRLSPPGRERRFRLYGEEIKIRAKTEQRLMFRRPAKIEDSGKDKAAVDVSPSGEEIKIQAKQSSG